MCLLKEQRIDKVEQKREIRVFISAAVGAAEVTSGVKAAGKKLK